MKLIVLSKTDHPELITQLQDRGHVVMITTSDFEAAVRAIFEYRPHAVIINGRVDDAFLKQAVEFTSGLPDLRLVLHQEIDSETTLDLQLEAVRQKVANYIQPPTPGDRLIFFDERYKTLTNGPELRAGKPEHEYLIQEQDRLLLLVEQAGVRQEAARRYRDQVKQSDHEEMREISYRMMHENCEGLANAQEQAGRWLAVLAHYVPAVELCYLPMPGDPIHGVRWVSYGSSPEVAYAFICLSHFGFVHNVCTSLRWLLRRKFDGGEDSITPYAVLSLIGSCGLIERVAEAQLNAMDRYLSSDAKTLLKDLQVASVRQEHQTVTEFWDMPMLREYPQLLAKTIDDYHRGRRSSASVAIPHFREVLAMIESEKIPI
jgi:hypothetical protein